MYKKIEAWYHGLKQEISSVGLHFIGDLLITVSYISLGLMFLYCFKTRPVSRRAGFLVLLVWISGFIYHLFGTLSLYYPTFAVAMGINKVFFAVVTFLLIFEIPNILQALSVGPTRQEVRKACATMEQAKEKLERITHISNKLDDRH
jgi:cation transport ATPase